MTRQRLAIAFCGIGIAVAPLVAAGCGSGSVGGTASRLTASGATFPAAAYQRWGRESGLASYAAKGSGGGITDLTNGVVDWAGSDAPLTPDETSTLASERGGAKPVYFPSLLGAVAVPVNVPGVSTPLKLDAAVLGDLFDGTITSWDDPAVARTNQGVKLPSAPVILCVRADSSGTSFSFSRFLARHNPEFASTVGESKAPAWTGDTVVKQPGNPGVANCVKSNDGAIGYVDLGDAQRAGLAGRLASVGVDGTFTAPTTATITEAGASAKPDPELVIDPGASDPAKGYPITVTTWIIAYSDYAAAGVDDPGGVRTWLDYVYRDKAQGQLRSQGFAPLPAAVAAKAKARIPTVK